MQQLFGNAMNEARYLATYLLRDNFVCNRMINELQRHEQFTEDELRALSRRFLLRTIKVAVKKIPLYRDISVNCDENEVEEFLVRNFPIITKEDLLAKRILLYPNGGRQRPWTIIGETGGTTGAAVRLFRSFASVLWQNAFLKRQWLWAGIEDGMPRAVLRGNIVVPVEQSDPPFWKFNRYNNQLLLSSLHVKQDTASHYVGVLEEFKPAMVEAYPSIIYDLALYMARQNRYVTIPYIFTASEQLYEHQRQIIEERFRGRIMDQYCMGERVTFATECEYGNLHLNTDHSYTEIVNEDGKPTDDYGYIVGTTFHNLLMPLVRYKMTDQGKWKQGTCPCKRHYPMIEKIKGRIEDIIIGSAGNDIGTMLFRVLYGVENIEKAQIAQVGRNRLEIRIMPIVGFGDAERRALISNLHNYVDPGMEASVVVVAEIPRTQRGKYRWIVNEYMNGGRDKSRVLR